MTNPKITVTKQPIVFAESGHSYSLNGRPLVAVTSVLRVLDKPALIAWAAKMAAGYFRDNWNPERVYTEQEKDALCEAAKSAHRAKSDEAKNHGRAVHAWIEAHTYGQEPPMPTEPERVAGISAYLDWFHSHHVEYVEAEWRVADAVEGVGGTADSLAWVDGLLGILDYKVSSGVYSEAYLQTGAYWKMASPLVSVPISQRIVLQIPKDGGPVIPVTLKTNPETDWLGFVAAKRLYDWTLTLPKKGGRA